MQIIPALSGSEDCLFLNIAAPVDRQALLPVMLWLHGGADILGSGPAEGATDAALVARSLGASNGPVVVVTINYRLNIFGFLGGAAVSSRSSDGGSGNFGIQDQR
mgnify:CR=1 FL=1